MSGYYDDGFLNFTDDDEYFEPTEAQMKMQEITGILKESVRQEIKDELKRLREENAELQKYKDHQEENDEALAEAMAELRGQQKELEQTIKKARIRELFGENIVTAWVAQLTYTQKPKCNKCNDERMIEYYSPRGVKKQESCECNEPIRTYTPYQTELISIETPSVWDSVKWNRTYYTASEVWTNGKPIEDSIHRTSDVYDGRAFDEISAYNATSTIFLDESKCKEFCDYLNSKGKERNKN